MAPRHVKVLIALDPEDRDWLDAQSDRIGLDSRAAYVRMMIRRERQEAAGEAVHPVASRGRAVVLPRATAAAVAHEAKAFDAEEHGADPDDIAARALAQAEDDGLTQVPMHHDPVVGNGAVQRLGGRVDRSARDWAARRT